MKFLHIADVHLDSPFKNVDPEKAALLRRSLRESLYRAFIYARANNIPLVLIAGDLFDDQYTSHETAVDLVRHFDDFSDLIFVISPGNHDPYDNFSLYKRITFPANVHIFTKNVLEKFNFCINEEKVDVYGYAFTSKSLDSCPFSSRVCSDKDAINLLCAHCDLTDPLAKKAYSTPAEIGKFGCDYAALGHIHNKFKDSFLKKSYETYFAYSGCIEGRGFDECDPMGGLVVNINKSSEAISNFSADFIEFSNHIYKIQNVDITGLSDTSELLGTINKSIGDPGRPINQISLRLVLTGSVSPDFTPDLKALSAYFNGYFSFEINDATLPFYSSDTLLEDPTIRGAFFRELLPILKNGSPEERKSAAEALRLGFAALSGSDIF